MTAVATTTQEASLATHSVAGNLNAEIMSDLTPLRGVLSFCYFFFGQAKKK